MGRSITCNFQVTVNLSNGPSPVYGAMSYKEVKGIIESEKQFQQAKGHAVVNAEIWPQTATGRKYLKGKDFAIMASDHTIDYYNVGDKIPFYCF